jgi:hypothetical protein
MDRPDRPPLHLRDEDALTIGYATDLYELLRVIDETIPKDAVLYVEGTSIVPAVSEFLEARQPAERPKAKAGTLWPRPRVFHLPLSGANLAELRSLADGYAEPEVADHLMVYRGDKVLLEAHDAGNGDIRLSRSLSPEVIERFRASISGSLRARK